MTPWRAEERILVIMGCGAGARDDMWFCSRFIGRFDVCAINRASELVPVDVIYSFHAELLPTFNVRGRHCAEPHFASCNPYPCVAHYPLPSAKRKGSSALQAAWLGLEAWGYEALVFSGVALDAADCFGVSADYSLFRRFWPAFAALHGERCRGLSGYTAELFGRPGPEWVAAQRGSAARQHGEGA